MSSHYEQYLEMANGKIVMPRHFALKQIAAEGWGEDNYIKVELEHGFDPSCYDDTPINVTSLKGKVANGFQGELVKNQERVDEFMATATEKEDLKLLSEKLIVAKTFVDPSKLDSDLTSIERKLKYGIGTIPTIAELQTYIDTNSQKEEQ